MMQGLAWIAVDWGTSNCRAWAMAADDAVLATASSDRGMGTLGRDDFEPALLDLIGAWLGADPVDVFACGMVGSRQGWAEARYQTVPCAPVGGGLTQVTARDPRLRVRIVPGLRQDDPSDVMRGEETQIAGWLADQPDFDGVLCLPGTHSKWVQVSAGEVVSFRTYMTGELFAALSDHTVLRHSLGDGWDDAAFEAALSTAMANPERLANRLFSIRAESLLSDLDPGAARARLSGLLIGSELAGARPYWLGQNVAIIGGATLSERYRAALALQGVPAQVAASDALTRAGLAALRSELTEVTQ
ncbi:MAG: 2-dehydro-3-deoxygalactonokinase [Pseudomonadota bacterium]